MKIHPWMESCQQRLKTLRLALGMLSGGEGSLWKSGKLKQGIKGPYDSGKPCPKIPGTSQNFFIQFLNDSSRHLPPSFLGLVVNCSHNTLISILYISASLFCPQYLYSLLLPNPFCLPEESPLADLSEGQQDDRWFLLSVGRHRKCMHLSMTTCPVKGVAKEGALLAFWMSSLHVPFTSCIVRAIIFPSCPQDSSSSSLVTLLMDNPACLIYNPIWLTKPASATLTAACPIGLHDNSVSSLFLLTWMSARKAQWPK